MSDHIGTAHKIVDMANHIEIERKNLKAAISAFKEYIQSIPQEDRPNVKMVLLADGFEIEKLPARFNALDAGLGE